MKMICTKSITYRIVHINVERPIDTLQVGITVLQHYGITVVP